MRCARKQFSLALHNPQLFTSQPLLMHSPNCLNEVFIQSNKQFLMYNVLGESIWKRLETSAKKWEKRTFKKPTRKWTFFTNIERFWKWLREISPLLWSFHIWLIKCFLKGFIKIIVSTSERIDFMQKCAHFDRYSIHGWRATRVPHLTKSSMLAPSENIDWVVTAKADTVYMFTANWSTIHVSGDVHFNCTPIPLYWNDDSPYLVVCEPAESCEKSKI